ncbi:MAG: ADOP family duplicated permease, partial [Gemmatimonadota bacterium]
MRVEDGGDDGRVEGAGGSRGGGDDPGSGRGGGDPDGRAGGLHARVFRLLLRLYPPSFRAVYGAEMTRFFLARLERAREAGGRTAVARRWLRVVVDVFVSAAAERRGGSASGRSRGKARESMSSFIHDLRHAARRLRKTPLFTVSAVLILAVGIGLDTAVFGLVDAMLFRPPPFEAPERLVHIYQDGDDGQPSSSSFPAYRDMAAMDDIFAGVAATSPDGATWQADGGPRQVAVEYATSGHFPVLGLEPSRGRWFGPEHDEVGGPLAAVVSHRTWRTRMGADPAVVGRTVRLNNQAVTIIGVGPESYNGEAGALVTDFWLSISSTPVGGPFRVANLERRQDHWYLVKARLAEGVTVARAEAAMDGLAARLMEAYPELNRGRGITVHPYDAIRIHPSVDGGLLAAGAGILVVAGLVLLLACGNLANLLLVRGIARAPELAVRKAMGAGRGRIARLLLLEALLISGLGGLAGLAVAWWAVGMVPALPLPIPGGGLDVGIDHRVVAFGLLLALATGLLFGLLPALRTAGTDVTEALRDEGRGRSAGRGAALLRGGLVVAQVAVSVVLVVGAGLLTRSLIRAQQVDPGVDAGRIAVLGTDLRQGGVADGEAPVVARELLERVEALPGVERSALTTRLPVDAGPTTTQVVEGYDPAAGTGSVELPFATVSQGYFETMGIGLRAGRTFAVDDGPETPSVVVVNEAAARRFWGGDAVGRRIRPQGADDAWARVVGVVEDVKVNDLRESPTPMIYNSAEQTVVSAFDLVARTRGGPAALTASLRTALHEVRPSLPVTRLGTLEAHLGDALAVPRTAATFMGGFSLLALLLAGLGVYAVVSFTVERRTHELGIRVALGASRSRLVRTVVGESVAVAALGVAVGLVLAAVATRGIEGMLFDVAALDGVTFAGAAALL